MKNTETLVIYIYISQKSYIKTVTGTISQLTKIWQRLSTKRRQNELNK